MIAAIVEAQENDLEDLPRCGPGEICPAILIAKGGLTDHKARAVIRRAKQSGAIVPAKITFIDDWGDKRSIKGYKLAAKSPGD